MNTNEPQNQDVPFPRSLSAEDFLALGAEDTAFIKPVETDEGATAYGIFSVYGQQIGVAEDFATAKAAVRQHDMQPQSVH